MPYSLSSRVLIGHLSFFLEHPSSTGFPYNQPITMQCNQSAYCDWLNLWKASATGEPEKQNLINLCYLRLMQLENLAEIRTFFAISGSFWRFKQFQPLILKSIQTSTFHLA